MGGTVDDDTAGEDRSDEDNEDEETVLCTGEFVFATEDDVFVVNSIIFQSRIFDDPF